MFEIRLQDRWGRVMVALFGPKAQRKAKRLAHVAGMLRNVVWFSIQITTAHIRGMLSAFIFPHSKAPFDGNNCHDEIPKPKPPGFHSYSIYCLDLKNKFT